LYLNFKRQTIFPDSGGEFSPPENYEKFTVIHNLANNNIKDMVNDIVHRGEYPKMGLSGEGTANATTTLGGRFVRRGAAGGRLFSQIL